jgi:hypothetical protein
MEFVSDLSLVIPSLNAAVAVFLAEVIFVLLTSMRPQDFVFVRLRGICMDLIVLPVLCFFWGLIAVVAKSSSPM